MASLDTEGTFVTWKNFEKVQDYEKYGKVRDFCLSKKHLLLFDKSGKVDIFETKKIGKEDEKIEAENDSKTPREYQKLVDVFANKLEGSMVTKAVYLEEKDLFIGISKNSILTFYKDNVNDEMDVLGLDDQPIDIIDIPGSRYAAIILKNGEIQILKMRSYFEKFTKFKVLEHEEPPIHFSFSKGTNEICVIGDSGSVRYSKILPFGKFIFNPSKRISDSKPLLIENTSSSTSIFIQNIDNPQKIEVLKLDPKSQNLLKSRSEFTLESLPTLATHLAYCQEDNILIVALRSLIKVYRCQNSTLNFESQDNMKFSLISDLEHPMEELETVEYFEQRLYISSRLGTVTYTFENGQFFEKSTDFSEFQLMNFSRTKKLAILSHCSQGTTIV